MSDKKQNLHILAVDDSEATRELIRRNLESKGYLVSTAPTVSAALEILQSDGIDLVITDMKMPQISGMELVRHIRDNLPDVEVMIVTGYPSVDGAVEAVKRGAEEYLTKPFTDDELFTAVQRVVDKLNRRRLQSAARQSAVVGSGLLGRSKAMQRVHRAVHKAAQTKATVLIVGESGTGKELVARAVHYSSAQSSAPFVPVNCGGIPESLLESELFGYVKGAFTGANESRAGFFQTADGGSLFLDEISETTPAMQVKLLRVLQEKEVQMVGSSRPRSVDVRIIAASNKDLMVLVDQGRFREDLFFRLNVLMIELPPLRERDEDIIVLARSFAEKFSQEFGKGAPSFTDRALEALMGYDWPGNVRELENMVHRSIIMLEGDRIDVSDLPRHVRFAIPRSTEVLRSLADVEREHVANVLSAVGGNKTKAAEILGIDRKTLRQKLK